MNQLTLSLLTDVVFILSTTLMYVSVCLLSYAVFRMIFGHLSKRLFGKVQRIEHFGFLGLFIAGLGYLCALLLTSLT